MAVDVDLGDADAVALDPGALGVLQQLKQDGLVFFAVDRL
jgi:hypothetical protein